MRCNRGDFSAERFAEKKGGRWEGGEGREGRLERAEELGNRIFLSEPFPSYVSLVAGLEQRGG